MTQFDGAARQLIWRVYGRMVSPNDNWEEVRAWVRAHDDRPYCGQHPQLFEIQTNVYGCLTHLEWHSRSRRGGVYMESRVSDATVIMIDCGTSATQDLFPDLERIAAAYGWRVETITIRTTSNLVSLPSDSAMCAIRLGGK